MQGSWKNARAAPLRRGQAGRGSGSGSLLVLRQAGEKGAPW